LGSVRTYGLFDVGCEALVVLVGTTFAPEQETRMLVEIVNATAHTTLYQE